MKIFIILFSLAFAVSNALAAGPAQISGNVVGLGVGGSATAPVSQIGIGSLGTVFSILSGDNSTATSNSFYPFYKDGVAYQVTAGKTAYCFDLVSNTGTAGNFFQLVSATASFTYGQSTALTGGVYSAGAAARYNLVVGPVATTEYSKSIVYKFGASTYVGWQAGNSQIYNIRMTCIEK